jgi:hypothetical protein
VGTLTSHNPMGLHGLLQGYLYFYLIGKRNHDLRCTIYSIYVRENGRSSLVINFRCRMLFRVLTTMSPLPLVRRERSETRSQRSITNEMSIPKSRYRNTMLTFLRRMDLTLSLSHPTRCHQYNHCSRF